MTASETVNRPDLDNARTRIVGTRDGALADGIVVVVQALRLARRRLLAAWRRVTAVVTLLGWSMGVAVALAFVAGYTFGWTEAILFAWVGLVLLALASAYLVGHTAYGVRLALPGNRVVVGQPATGDIVVGNPGGRRLPGVRVEVPVGKGLAEYVMPALEPGDQFRETFLVPTARRGVIQVGPVGTIRGDPVGLLRREVVWSQTGTVYVHPRTVAVPSMSTGFIRDLEGSPTRDLTTNDVSFHALREYVSGDERRNIHWKSTAKTGSYMVRQYEETRRSHLLVALSLAPADYQGEEEFELAVSIAASLGVRAIRDARNVTVVASATTPEFAKRAVYALRSLSTVNRSRLLDDLAGVTLSPGALALNELARVASDSAAGMSVAFLICGSTVSPAQLRAAAGHFALGVNVVVIVCAPGTSPSLRKMADLNVFRAGLLEDLPASLRRSAAEA